MNHSYWEKISEDEFKDLLASKNACITDLNMIIDPPVRFYWDKYYPNMAFGENSLGCIKYEDNRDGNPPTKFYYLRKEIKNE